VVASWGVVVTLIIAYFIFICCRYFCDFTVADDSNGGGCMLL